jgi:hypothetical protein
MFLKQKNIISIMIAFLYYFTRFAFCSATAPLLAKLVFLCLHEMDERRAGKT